MEARDRVSKDVEELYHNSKEGLLVAMYVNHLHLLHVAVRLEYDTKSPTLSLGCRKYKV